MIHDLYDQFQFTRDPLRIILTFNRKSLTFTAG